MTETDHIFRISHYHQNELIFYCLNTHMELKMERSFCVTLVLY
jgi:hypothetical protein